MQIITVLVFLGVFVWWLTDCVRIGSGWYLDGNGALVYDDM